MDSTKFGVLLTSSRSGCLTNWRLWIRPVWMSFYALLLLIAVPCLVLGCINTPVVGSRPNIQLVGGLFALTTIPISLWEIVQHLTHYTKPLLQKHIIRILYMVPIYCVDAWFDLIYPDNSIYINSLRDCYTAYVIYSFMRFLLNYLQSQDGYESSLETKSAVKHIPPCCCLQSWEMGPQFVKRCQNGILQFTVVRPLTTAAAFICEMLGVYGENEMRFSVGYPYIFIINNISQMIAMYCLVLFYKANRTELAPMNPLGKFICIKSVVFLTVFQAGIISILVNTGVIQLIFGIEDGAEIAIVSSSLQNLLICIEMLFAAIAHHYVFSYRPYVESEMEDLYCCEAFGLFCHGTQSEAGCERQRLLPYSTSKSKSIGQSHSYDGVGPGFVNNNTNPRTMLSKGQSSISRVAT